MGETEAATFEHFFALTLQDHRPWLERLRRLRLEEIGNSESLWRRRRRRGGLLH
jgi:hypothetical protein